MLKKRFAAFACAAAVAGCCVFGTPGELSMYADAAGSIISTSGASSYNIADSANHYSEIHDKRVFSYMYEDTSKNVLNRVEYINGQLVVEQYDMSTGALKNTKKVSLSNSKFSTSPIFGGFFAGEEFNFVVLGQENPDEDDNKPILSVTRYSKDFSSFSMSYVTGCNTTVPFDAGSCRMAEANGKLYIHTCHEMYAIKGVNHQANMSFVVNESDMTFLEKYYEVANDEIYGSVDYFGSAFGYASHSFDQFVALDSEALYAYDQGDANPRSLRINRFDLNTRKLEYTDLVTIPESTAHYNYTGVNTGDMELSSDHVLVGVKMVNMNGSSLEPYTTLKDIYVLNVAKSDILHNKSAAGSVNLTNYTGAQKSSGMKNTAPKMTKINNNKFLVMWSEINSSNVVTKIAFVNGSGQLIGSISESSEVVVSDCDPILCSDGMVRWYATNNSSPVIYTLDPSTPNDFSGGSSTVRIPGDANGDGIFNLQDLGTVQRYICHWQDLNIDVSAADVNGDGKVNMRDLGLMQMQLAGWDVVFV